MDKATGNAKDLVDDGVKLFLVYDFDGVFNVMYRNGTFKKSFYSPTHRQHHPNPLYVEEKDKLKAKSLRWKNPKSYELVWSDDLVQDSNKLSDRDDVQVLWLTTWRKDMDKVSDRLNFSYARKPLYLEWGSTDSFYDHFEKIDAFLDFFNGFEDDSVGVVWADDVVHKSPHLVRKDVSTVSALNEDNLLLLCPHDWYGVSRDEWNDVKEFSKKFLD